MLTCDDYIRVGSLAEAFDVMDANIGRARYVAGATDLLPWTREGRAGDVHIPVLIDISGVGELACRSFTKGRVRVGASTPFQRFLDDPALTEALPSMQHCAVWFADDQIRECATLGGNLVNASPAADASPPMLAHNAVAEIATRREGQILRRHVPLARFFTGPGRTVLESDEILVSLECDALQGYGGSFQKVGHRRSLVISVACVAALVSLTSDKSHFDDVRLAVGGVGPVPFRLKDAEALLRAAPVDWATVEAAAATALDLVQSRTRQTYRRSVLRGFIGRALTEAAREAGAMIEALSTRLEASYA